MLYLATTFFTSAAAGSSANAEIIDEYLEKSKARTRFVLSEKEPNFRISIKDKRSSGVKLVQSCGIFYLQERVHFNLAAAGFPRTSPAAKILPSRRKCHSSQMIWSWSDKERTNTSVVAKCFLGMVKIASLCL